ncbi:MAG: hypothetical protein KJS87_06130 [Alphaproteobacteria bacterium]|nr:hypothetical protein [Alphaproteobacteria bacterium]
MGGSLVVTIAAVLALNNVKTPEMAIIAPATAAEESVEMAPAAPPVARTISFTVTGKRLPKECKGEPASQEIAERCEALRDRTTVTVR